MRPAMPSVSAIVVTCCGLSAGAVAAGAADRVAAPPDTKEICTEVALRDAETTESVTGVVEVLPLMSGGRGADIWLRDCTADTGTEPSGCDPWWLSPDIWIAPGSVQMLPAFCYYPLENRWSITVRNRGTAPAANVSVKLYYRLASTGLTFPDGATELASRTLLLPISAGGSRTIHLLADALTFPWSDHYCYGVVLSCTGDSAGTSSTVPADNNKACTNQPRLFHKFTGGLLLLADFLAEIPDGMDLPGLNYMWLESFLPAMPQWETELWYQEDPAGEWMLYEPGTPFWLDGTPEDDVPFQLAIYGPPDPQQGLIGSVRVWQEHESGEMMGGIDYDVYQDNNPPEAISDLTAVVKPGGPILLNWTPPAVDTEGDEEFVAYYEIHRSTEADFEPDESTLAGETAIDEDLGRDGWQYLDDSALLSGQHYHYKVIAVDFVEWMSEPSNEAGAIATGLWCEDFDSYDTAVALPDQSTWESWDDDPAAAEFYVTTAQSLSEPNALAIDDIDDAVHRYSGYTEGVWAYTAWQYVPPEMDDIQYFILLNTYPASVSPDWSMQIECDGGAGLIKDFNGDEALPMVKGQWTEIRVLIDLDEDVQSVYYNGAHLVTKSWSAGVAEGGAVNIAAVDIWGNESTCEVYYDDIRLEWATKFLHGPDYDPFQPVQDPMTAIWYQLCPEYGPWWMCVKWIDNGNGYLDPCDYMKLFEVDLLGQEGEWWHVERVTVTVRLKDEPPQWPPLFLEWTGEEVGVPFDPIGPWHEVYPKYCTPWQCIDWIDNGSGVLDECDWLIFETAEGIVEKHVAEVGTDLEVVKQNPPCPADVNGDGVVDVLDLLAILAAWGQSGVPADVNGDGIVDVLDLLEVLAAWGPCP